MSNLYDKDFYGQIAHSQPFKEPFPQAISGNLASCLHRSQKQIQQGLTLYRVPDDLESLVRILIKILEP